MSRKRPSPWIPVVVIGAIAGTVGIIAYAKNASAKEALPPNPMLTPITDPAVVRHWQTKTAVAAQNGSLIIFGISSVDYNSNDVDGNPANPRWMRVLSIIQTFVNALLPKLSAEEKDKIPAGYPTQLRSDGVLDNATVIALEHL